MSNLIQTWLSRLFDHEGGYSNDPRDPGGETKYGISKRSYPQVDIKNLTLQDAADIYLQDFLAPLKWDMYADGVAFQLLDFAVNSGPPEAIKRIQREVGAKPDGILGSTTISRISAMSESDLIMLLIASRIEFMTGLKNWPDAGRGWMRRMAKNLRYGASDS